MQAMSTTSFRQKFKLVRRWGYQCIVCGRPFANLACVTAEHIIPRSKVGNKNKSTNMAPSHFRCNELKRDFSLLEAARKVDQKEQQLGANNFQMWLNTKVPARTVPWYALIPILDAEWFLF